MDISYYTNRSGLNPATGYGYAGQNIVKSLTELGHRVFFANPEMKVQLNFIQPDYYKLHKNQYQIGYTPWESTELKEGWLEKFNLCDEVWATSDWVAQVYKDCGVEKPIYVYPHGIDPMWIPKKRFKNDGQPLKFLHIGEPATRKDGQMVVEVFNTLFGNDERYQLTIKAFHNNTTRLFNSRGEITSPEVLCNNINIITKELSQEELVKLYHDHHVLVYPSWGEGFGFIPLQALASGMPVISTYDWAHYKNYLGPLKLKSKLTDESPPRSMGNEHIGKMFKPDKDNLIDQMLEFSKNYKAYFGYYYAQSTKIHEEYNWLQLTNKAFKHIFKKFE